MHFRKSKCSQKRILVWGHCLLDQRGSQAAMFFTSRVNGNLHIPSIQVSFNITPKLQMHSDVCAKFILFLLFYYSFWYFTTLLVVSGMLLCTVIDNRLSSFFSFQSVVSHFQDFQSKKIAVEQWVLPGVLANA